jgi:hypothetical protein
LAATLLLHPLGLVCASASSAIEIIVTATTPTSPVTAKRPKIASIVVLALNQSKLCFTYMFSDKYTKKYLKMESYMYFLV